MKAVTDTSEELWGARQVWAFQGAVLAIALVLHQVIQHS